MKEEDIFQKLEDWGCDITGAMERFLSDEELYVSCLEMLLSDCNFEKLGTALKEKDTAQAFDYSHTLKGVFANLGLTPMFLLAEQIVEPLRRGSSEELWKEYEALLEAKEVLNDILRK